MEMVIVSFEGGMEGVCNILKKKFRGEHGPRDRDGDEPPRNGMHEALACTQHGPPRDRSWTVPPTLAARWLVEVADATRRRVLMGPQ